MESLHTVDEGTVKGLDEDTVKGKDMGREVYAHEFSTEDNKYNKDRVERNCNKDYARNMANKTSWGREVNTSRAADRSRDRNNKVCSPYC